MSPPDGSSWDVRVTQAPECLEVDPRTPFRGTEGQESPAAGPIGAYVWRTSLEHGSAVRLSHPATPCHLGISPILLIKAGPGVAEHELGSPRRPRPLHPSSPSSPPGWRRPLVDDRLIRHPSQSFLLLSPLLSDRSTRRLSEQPDRDRLDCSRCLCSPLAHASLLPQPAPCIYAVKPHLHMAPTRDKHALPPLRIRVVQVFDTRPRADHGPVPTDTHLSRDNLPGSNCSGPPIRRHCRTQTRSCCTSAERR